jgi:Adenine-specific methyltransferase EcoRI
VGTAAYLSVFIFAVMPPKSLNKNLQAAKTGKKDEFYTQLSDIERELKHYKTHLRGKTVLCNCDDPRISNFFHYFSYRFEELGLKKLITTCYKNQDTDLFSQHASESAVKLEYHGDRNGDRIPSADEIGVVALRGDGDFRSPESIALLQEADIVVTNPPFSLFREYVTQLMAHDKKFIVLGNLNAISYREIFKLIKDNKLWMGGSIKSGDREFQVPQEYELNAAGSRVDEEGNKFIRVKGVRWFTNLDFEERHEELILTKKYSPIEFPNYDNYNAINVDVTKDIPCDYPGVMGVPITFLDKYNPDQFEILGMTDRDNRWGLKSREYTRNDMPNFADLNGRSVLLTNGEYRKTYVRLLIRNKTL